MGTEKAVPRQTGPGRGQREVWMAWDAGPRTEEGAGEDPGETQELVGVEVDVWPVACLTAEPWGAHSLARIMEGGQRVWAGMWRKCHLPPTNTDRREKVQLPGKAVSSSSESTRDLQHFQT